MALLEATECGGQLAVWGQEAEEGLMPSVAIGERVWGDGVTISYEIPTDSGNSCSPHHIHLLILLQIPAHWLLPKIGTLYSALMAVFICQSARAIL